MFRDPFAYDRKAASIAARPKMDAPSRTQQQFKLESDINELVRRFGLTGDLPTPIRQPQFGDFSNVTDYHTAMTQLRAAQEEFNSLPAQLRDRFRNDPGRFVDFVLDPENREELADMGLLSREAVTRMAQEAETAAKPAEEPPAAAGGDPAAS